MLLSTDLMEGNQSGRLHRPDKKTLLKVKRKVQELSDTMLEQLPNFEELMPEQVAAGVVICARKLCEVESDKILLGTVMGQNLNSIGLKRCINHLMLLFRPEATQNTSPVKSKLHLKLPPLSSPDKQSPTQSG